MKKQKLILIGGGGHCRASIDVIESIDQFQIVGILDIPEYFGMNSLNFNVIGCDEDIDKFHEDGCAFIVTIGQIKSALNRKIIYEKLQHIGANTPSIIAKTAYVSRYASINSGTIVMHRAFINANVNIGENCIINSNALIEHDVQIGDHTHISTCVVINGDCKIGSGTFIGSNATVSSQVKIGDNVIVGAGSVVIRNVESNSVMIGIPAKKVN